jgi:signal transduction histidine kinase
MTTFQVMLSFISAIFLTISIYYFLRFFLVTRTIDKFLYFALSIFGCGFFALFELLLSYPIAPEQALLFHRLRLAFLVMVMVFWFFCIYEIFFRRSRVPKIFMVLGLLVALTIPFPFFLHLPVHHLQVVFLGIRFDYRFASYGPGYILLSLFVVGTYGFSALKVLFASLKWRDKTLALLAFVPAIVAGFNDFAVGRGERSGILVAEYVVFAYLITIFTIFFIEEQRNHRRLQRVNAELELLVGERTSELQLANTVLSTTNEELQNANRLKTELLGIAAHDLKNPLQAILGYSEFIMRIATENERIMKQSEVIHRSSERMLRLINELLESSTVESGKIELQPRSVNLGALVRLVAEGSRDEAAAKGQQILLSGGDDCRIMADEGRLQEIVENLVSNAIKYSPPGKAIRVRVAGVGPRVRLEVQDEGPGLSAEDQGKLFEKFQRLGPRPTGGEASTGLGLYIVKKLVELQGGEIGVASEPERGSTFAVTFPKAH